MTRTQDETVSHAYHTSLDWLSKLYFMTEPTLAALELRLLDEARRAKAGTDREAVRALARAVAVYREAK
jgi:hypothetical protein